MRYRRVRKEGGTYFFTLLTFKRSRILTKPENVTLLREAFRGVMDKHAFRIEAFVLLHDHLHCIWTLPDGDSDVSKRWRLIKSRFTRECSGAHKHAPLGSRRRKGEQAVWQRRFWEHLVRDDEDLVKHVEYIHYNPVKHGLVNAPKDWEYSSYREYLGHHRLLRVNTRVILDMCGGLEGFIKNSQVMADENLM